MKVSLQRDVTMEECPWLDEDIKSGTEFYRFDGHTYGCIGPTGIAVTTWPDRGPFIELPVDALLPTPPQDREATKP